VAALADIALTWEVLRTSTCWGSGHRGQWDELISRCSRDRAQGCAIVGLVVLDDGLRERDRGAVEVADPAAYRSLIR